MSSATTPDAHRSQYARVERMIADGVCVVLDGSTGATLVDVGGQRPESEEHLWGLTAVVDTPQRVIDVHRSYVDIGCDVISTNTWGLATALRGAPPKVWSQSEPVHWMDVARRGIELARTAVDEGGRGDEVAVAFSLNGDIDHDDGTETVRLLARALESAPPDLILLETLSLVRNSTFDTVRALIDTGVPVWLSFRRCRHGSCGVYGEHWGGPDGDAFGRAARRLEELGVGALMVNCIPPDHVPGMVSWLRDFTDLPLGVYPNLGYLSAAGWRQPDSIGGDEYAQLALGWREEGAQIIGGCCGVGPEHIRAANLVLGDTVAGHARPRPPIPEHDPADASRVSRWLDTRGRPLLPLDVPKIAVEPGVIAPTAASLLVWKRLYHESIGAHQRCLDVGCGTGLLGVQLARNGAAHVHAIDVDPAAVTNTMTNAFRNDVADRVSAATSDLYPWIAPERYDVVVANLQQVPADPFEQVTTHRTADFWGRGLLDRLFALLPEALADDGVAYVSQVSVVGGRRTIQQLDALGLNSRVVDYSFMDLGPLPDSSRDQIDRVESHSDAYHVQLGSSVAVVYLLEITRAPTSAG